MFDFQALMQCEFVALLRKFDYSRGDPIRCLTKIFCTVGELIRILF
jgi:hypothetical protein